MIGGATMAAILCEEVDKNTHTHTSRGTFFSMRGERGGREEKRRGEKKRIEGRGRREEEREV